MIRLCAHNSARLIHYSRVDIRWEVIVELQSGSGRLSSRIQQEWFNIGGSSASAAKGLPVVTVEALQIHS